MGCGASWCPCGFPLVPLRVWDQATELQGPREPQFENHQPRPAFPMGEELNYSLLIFINSCHCPTAKKQSPHAVSCLTVFHMSPAIWLNLGWSHYAPRKWCVSVNLILNCLVICVSFIFLFHESSILKRYPELPDCLDLTLCVDVYPLWERWSKAVTALYPCCLICAAPRGFALIPSRPKQYSKR